MKRKYKYLDSLEETHTSMVILAFLSFPQKPAVVWDVGSGGGKVLIESKLRYRDVKLIGIESNPAYEKIMQLNMESHGIEKEAIDFVLRDAVTDDLGDLPKPDAIYLSFAGTAKEDLIPKLWAHLNPGGVIVCNVAKEGNVERLQRAQATYGGELGGYVYPGPMSKLLGRHFTNDVLHWTGKKPG